MFNWYCYRHLKILAKGGSAQPKAVQFYWKEISFTEMISGWRKVGSDWLKGDDLYWKGVSSETYQSRNKWTNQHYSKIDIRRWYARHGPEIVWRKENLWGNNLRYKKGRRDIAGLIKRLITSKLFDAGHVELGWLRSLSARRNGSYVTRESISYSYIHICAYSFYFEGSTLLRHPELTFIYGLCQIPIRPYQSFYKTLYEKNKNLFR